MPRRRLLLLLALLPAAGCVALPQDGPVVVSEDPQSEVRGPGVAYVPKPPQPGESPRDVVRHFLDAMTAVPLQPSVARQFLAEDEQTDWDPDRGILTYEESGPPRGTTVVTVGLRGTARLDGRGRWRGSTSSGETDLSLPLVQEDGEWRIADAPDALVVPQAWFAQQFRRVNLHFFDPTATVLVPEPVWLPQGEQLATGLVRGLLAGPGGALRGVERSFLPPGTAVELSVVVSTEGVAEVSLQGDPAALPPAARGLALAQLAWTLRQDPGIRALRLSIGGEPISAPDGPSELPVEAYADVDPTLLTSSSQLFGLRRGRVVVVTPGGRSRSAGRWDRATTRCATWPWACGPRGSPGSRATAALPGWDRWTRRPGRASSATPARTCCARPGTTTDDCGSSTGPRTACGSPWPAARSAAASGSPG